MKFSIENVSFFLLFRSEPILAAEKKKTRMKIFKRECFFSCMGIALFFFRARMGRCEKGPPFHGSRSSRKIKIQNASCQMGGRERSRSYRGINQNPSLPWNFIGGGQTCNN